jgi:hypothetical protein
MNVPADTPTPITAYDWLPLPDYGGLSVLTLSSTFDEVNCTGRRTRMVRFDPGAETSQTLVHDYHEEAFLMSGDIQGIGAAEGFGSHTERAYVYRAPGTPHGPIRSQGGCVLFEIRYY